MLGLLLLSQHGIHFSALLNRGHALPWEPGGAERLYLTLPHHLLLYLLWRCLIPLVLVWD